MSSPHEDTSHLTRLLATLLERGTQGSSFVIAAGVLLELLHRTPLASTITAAGIAMLIALPVLRVTLMMIVFAKRRDYRFAVISATVLVIILVGFGLAMALHRTGG